MNNDNTAIKNVIPIAGWLLLASAILFYLYGVGSAIYQSFQVKPDFSEFLATSITAIQGLLLTNVGYILGISVAQPNSALGSAMRLSSVETTESLDVKDIVQVITSTLYVVSLIACAVTLLINADALPVVKDSAKMLIAVAVAYLTVYLRK